MFFSSLPCLSTKRPQSRRERFFPLVRHSFPFALQRPAQTLFRVPAVQLIFPPCNRNRRSLRPPRLQAPRKRVSPVCSIFSLLLDKPPAQRLSGAFARIPRSPLPCRCFVLEWLLTVAVPHITIYRIFNHTRTICSILIVASKMPLHQSAGAFFLLSGLEQVLQQRILEEKPYQNKAVTHNYNFAILGGFPCSSDTILLG